MIYFDQTNRETAKRSAIVTLHNRNNLETKLAFVEAVLLL